MTAASFGLYKSSITCYSIEIVNIAWDLEEELFIRVLAVLLKLLPLSKHAANSS
jgi:hypothetical protein